MRLAYGKFDPEINPPPFSDWSKSMTAVEVDLFQYFSWKPKTVAYFCAWVKRKNIRIIPRFGVRTERSREVYQDALAVWEETFSDETLYFLVHSGRSVWSSDQALKEIKKLPETSRFSIEWGRDDSLKSVDFMKDFNGFQGFTIDPEWHHSSLAALDTVSLAFKLHGWCEERWVRRYGVTRSAQILRTVKKRKGEILTLSYSGKVAEAAFFDSSLNQKAPDT